MFLGHLRKLIGVATLAGAIFASTAVPTYAGNGLGVLDFYEGNNCSQDVLSLSDAPGTYKLGNYGWNDEARSLHLINIQTPTTIRVFDNSSGSRSDDWTEIVISQPAADVCIQTFEQSVALYSSGVQVGWMSHHHRDNLDGKVSRVEVQ